MKQSARIAIFAVAIFLSSCYSAMKVKVDALNMPAFKATYLYNVERINTIEKNVRYLISSNFTNSVTELINSVNQFIDTSGVYSDDDTPKYKEDIKTRSDDIIPDLVDFGNKVLYASTQFKTSANDSLLQEFERAYANFSVQFFRLVEFNNYLKELTADFVVPLNTKTDMLLQDVSATIGAVRSEFGESILKDPVASIIAALPEQYWSKYHKTVNLSNNSGEVDQRSLGEIGKYVINKPNRYNTTIARTKIGNSDIAIRMSAPGEFIVKGVRVDADEAVRNSFKVVSQGIKYLAYASGVPVVEAPNAPKKSITPLLDSLTQRENDFKSAEDNYVRATDAFLAVLINSSPDLNAKTGKNGLTAQQVRDAAVARIKTAYDIYKSALGKK